MCDRKFPQSPVSAPSSSPAVQRVKEILNAGRGRSEGAPTGRFPGSHPSPGPMKRPTTAQPRASRCIPFYETTALGPRPQFVRWRSALICANLWTHPASPAPFESGEFVHRWHRFSEIEEAGLRPVATRIEERCCTGIGSRGTEPGLASCGAEALAMHESGSATYAVSSGHPGPLIWKDQSRGELLDFWNGTFCGSVRSWSSPGLRKAKAEGAEGIGVMPHKSTPVDIMPVRGRERFRSSPVVGPWRSLPSERPSNLSSVRRRKGEVAS